jgi:micrococcal nuclease
MYEYHARVKRVVDGDTVDFEVDLGLKVKINIRGRFVGVDTPERGHGDWVSASSKCYQLLKSVALSNKANESDNEVWVKIRTHKTGKYGRWLVEIDGVTDVLAKIWPYGEEK